MADSEDIPLGPHFDEAADFIHSSLEVKQSKVKQLIEDKPVVFVHCFGGMHRSPTMLMAYLIKYEHMSIDTALKVIMCGRSMVKMTEHHLDELREYEHNLKT